MNLTEIDYQAGPPQVAPPLTGGALLNLDGQLFRGPAGMLAVALSESSLQALLRGSEPSQWVLPWEKNWVTPYLARIRQPILWTAARPPQAVIGALHDGVQGAWLESAHVVLRLDGVERHLIVQRRPASGFVLPYLARLLVREWLERNQAAPVSRDSQHNPLPIRSMKTHHVTLFPGNGTRPEGADAARRVLDMPGVKNNWEIAHARSED